MRFAKQTLRFTLCYLASVGVDAGKVIPVEDPAADSYIIVLKDVSSASVKAKADELVAANVGATVTAVYEKAIQGFAAKMTAEVAEAMAESHEVDFISQNGYAYADQVTWGLDRSDQVELPLDNIYSPYGRGNGVTAYIIDTGILNSHEEFGGRASFGINTTGDGNDTDCNGHGTHVAGTVAGKVYGIANEAHVVAVKVLGCSGSGTWAGVISGVEWVMNNNAGKLATANMSLGGGKNSAVDLAVNNLHNSGVPTVVAAGNSNQDACNYSPAGATDVISVASTTKTDVRSTFSNWGTCVEIAAPGTDIKSAWINGNSDYRTISGTSMASPHVCGGAALLLEKNTPPADVLGLLQDMATPDVIGGLPTATPNLLLYVGGSSEPTVSPRPTEVPTPRPSVAPSKSPAPTNVPTLRPSVPPTQSPAPTNVPTLRPSVPPTQSPAPTNVPTPAPTYFCEDSRAYFIFQGKKRKCATYVAKRPNLCKNHKTIAIACPKTCDACEFSCEDSQLPFVASKFTRSGKVWTCMELAGKTQPIIDKKCKKRRVYTTCRDTCGVCGEKIIINFDGSGDDSKQYFRDDIMLENYWSIRGGLEHPGSGYEYGTHSQPNAGFNGYSSPMTMSCPGGKFSLISTWMTPAWSNGLVVTLDGWENGSLKVTRSFTLRDTQTKTFFDSQLSDFKDLDSLVLSSSSHTVVDDITIEISKDCTVIPQEADPKVDANAGIALVNVA